MLIKVIYVLLLFINVNVVMAQQKTPKINEIQDTISNYGFRALLVEDHDSPIISVALTFKNAGYSYDAPDKQGLATMASMIMTEGIKSRDQFEFAEIIESKGIELDLDVDIDSLHIRFKTLTKNIDTALELVQEAITNSEFDTNAIDRIKERLKIAHQARDNNPQALVTQKFMEIAFKDHSYSQSKLGNANTIDNITADDLTEYVTKSINRVNMVISVAGDINAHKFSDLLDKYFIDLPLVSENTKSINHIDVNQDVTVTHFLHQDFAQSAILFGQQGIKPTEDQYYTALIMNYILGGGGFQSMLFDELRERRGLVYGITTKFAFYEHANMWCGYTSTTDPTNVMDLIRESIATFTRDGVSAKDLDNAKINIINNLAINLDTNSKITEILQKMQIMKLGKNYVAELPEKINKVSAEDVMNMAREMLDPTHLIFVSVGK